MEFAKVKASENVTDQYNKVRLIKGNEYSLMGEDDDNYLVKDETGKTIFFDRRYFEN